MSWVGTALKYGRINPVNVIITLDNNMISMAIQKNRIKKHSFAPKDYLLLKVNEL